MSKYFSPNSTTFENFQTLADLNSTLSAACQPYGPISIKANKYKGVLNNQLDLPMLFSGTISQSMSIKILGFKGLDLNLLPQLGAYLANSAQQNSEISCMTYSLSSVDLYMNGDPVVMSTDGGHSCDESQLIEIFNKTPVSTSIYTWAANNTIFTNLIQSRGPLCPLAIKNAKMTSMQVSGGQPIKFFSEKSRFELNTNISELFLNFVAIEKLDNTILHSQVFSQLEKFSLNGALKRIAVDVFKGMYLNPPSILFFTV
jgi:hypothetical protein